MPVTLTLDEVLDVATRALRASGANERAARSVATSIAAAEREGISSHGLAYLPVYCTHLRCGKVRADAQPRLEERGSVVLVDADSGFAHEAIDLGFDRLVPLARSLGCAALAVRNSYNCGVLGYHTELLARQGLVGLGFTNSPASIAPIGGRRPVVGTNPWSLATPDGHGGIGLLIDQSASVIAKSEVMKHARTGQAIPAHWAMDQNGDPTTDPQAALKGSMAPAGGYKGVGSGLLVEVFAACLTGATLGIAASPFTGEAGGPPRTGQFFIAVSPEATSSGGFQANISSLVEAIAGQPGARVPGSRRGRNAERNAKSGITIDDALHGSIKGLLP